jgi:RAT1-interacting protein
VGFRTPTGELATVQTFKTIQIPRLIQGKPGAWDPLVCLDWGQKFLTFLKEMTGGQSADDSVWRVKFIPKEGVRVVKLDRLAVAEEVVGDEDRTGFLPKWYWERLATEGAPKYIGSGPSNGATSQGVAGWQI